MLKKLREALKSGRIILIFGIIYGISQVLIGIILFPVLTEIGALQTSFSPEFVRDTLEAWRQSGELARYQQHFWVDFIHPVWYTIALTAGLANVFTMRSIPDRWNFFLLFPVIGGICDLIENISHQNFIGNPNSITGAAVAISAAAAWIKWILLIGSLITVLIVRYAMKPKDSTSP